MSFRFLEAKLQRSWTKNNTIKILDMLDDYYVIHFSNQDDYNHAFFEGPWLIVERYLIV